MDIAAAKDCRTNFLLEALSPERLTRVVDVGANPLEEPAYTRLFQLGGCEVWGFEPQEEAFQLLQKNLRPREFYLPYAIGDGKKAKLNIYSNSGFTSLLTINPKLASLGLFKRSTRLIKQVDVETRRLDDMPELPEFDLLKIDIQGGEISVFQNATRHLSKAVAVITEVAAIPLYINQPLLDEQMRTLRGLGFDLHKFMFFKSLHRKNHATKNFKNRKHRNQMIDGDGVFLRGIMDLSDLDAQQLRHQAILADSVFSSYDVTASLIAELISRQEIAQDVLVDYCRLLEQAGEM